MSPVVFLNFTSKISSRSSKRQTSIVHPTPYFWQSKVALFLSNFTFYVVRLCWISDNTALRLLLEVQFKLKGPRAIVSEICDKDGGDFWDSRGYFSDGLLVSSGFCFRDCLTVCVRAVASFYGCGARSTFSFCVGGAGLRPAFVFGLVWGFGLTATLRGVLRLVETICVAAPVLGLSREVTGCTSLSDCFDSFFTCWEFFT